MSVSVVIPTLRPRFLGEALEALARCENRERLEVIVAENGERDPRVAADIEAAGSRLTIKHVFVEQAGANRARNAGAREARGDLLLFLDDDCLAQADVVSATERAHQDLSDAAAIGGRVMLRPLQALPGWLAGVFIDYLSRLDWGDEAVLIDDHKRYIVSACLSIRRDTFEEVGGFDDDIGHRSRKPPQFSHDETALMHRLRLAGRGIGYHPGLAIEHLIPPDRMTLEFMLHRAYGQGRSDIVLARHGLKLSANAPEAQYQQLLTSPRPAKNMQRTAAQMDGADGARFRDHFIRSRLALLRGAYDELHGNPVAPYGWQQWHDSPDVFDAQVLAELPPEFLRSMVEAPITATDGA